MSRLLNASQAAYARTLARAIGLEREAVEAWLLCEEPATRSPRLQGYNWLNLLDLAAYRAHGDQSYSGAPVIGFSPAGFAMFESVAAAAGEAAFWVNRFSNYAGIRASAGAGALAQVDAIAASPWDAGHYGNGATIRANLALVQASHPIRRRIRRRWEVRWPGAGVEHRRRVRYPFLFCLHRQAIKRAARKAGKPIEVWPR